MVDIRDKQSAFINSHRRTLNKLAGEARDAGRPIKLLTIEGPAALKSVQEFKKESCASVGSLSGFIR